MMMFRLFVIIFIFASYESVEAQIGMDFSKVPVKTIVLSKQFPKLSFDTWQLQPVFSISTPQSLPPFQLPEIPLGFFCKFEDKLQKNWKIPINFELK
jgi:hypothetical protein